jgi:hypothetical protein
MQLREQLHHVTVSLQQPNLLSLLAAAHAPRYQRRSIQT